jgi:sec-independent protein translocase protein TatB
VITISPLKVLIVLVVALLLLGPDKVPQAARQIGAGWSAFRKFRQRMEEEIRETVPDLPATHEIVRAVRSPMSFLDNLADLHGDTTTKDTADASASEEGEGGSTRAEGSDSKDDASKDRAAQSGAQTGIEGSTETGPEAGSASAQAPTPVAEAASGATRSYRFTVPDDPSLN